MSSLDGYGKKGDMLQRLLLIVFFSASLLAQTPTLPAPASAVKAPALDEADSLMLQIVSLAAARSNDQCSALQATKDYIQLKQQVATRMETKHPGYTVNWATMALTAKTAPVKAEAQAKP